MLDKSLVSRWNLPSETQISPLDVPGNDTIQRYLIKSERGSFVLSCYPGNRKDQVLSIRQLVNDLAENGISVLQPVRSVNDTVIESFEEQIYMLKPFGTPISVEDINSVQLYEKISDTLRIFKSITPAMNISHEIKKRELLPEAVSVRMLINADSKEEEQSIRTLFAYVDTHILRYVPYLEKCFCHGDLHPGNILIVDNTPVFIDWEHVFFGPALYDLAFLTGCIGFNGKDIMLGDLLKPLFTDIARKVKPDKLSIETFFPLVLTTRLLWLDRWLKEVDKEMVQNETGYLQWLYEHRKELHLKWLHWFEENEDHKRVKWVVQDAIFNKEVADHKKLIENSSIKTVGEYLEAGQVSPEEAAENLRSMVIAFGKEGTITKVIDLLIMQESLYTKWEGEKGFLSELGFTYANASLDFSRYHLPTALKRIIETMKELCLKFPDSIESSIALSFILRNWSILLSEQKRYLDSFKVIDRIRSLYNETGKIPEVAGEYARALSSGVITSLQNHDKRRLDGYFSELQQLSIAFPDSKKIHGAILFARKNIAKQW